MAHPSHNLATSASLQSDERDLVTLADVCFEMFPVKELRRPYLILDELRSAFPDFEDAELLQAVSMALTWRRLLRAAGGPLH